MKAPGLALLAALGLVAPAASAHEPAQPDGAPPRIVPPPDTSYSYAQPQYSPTLAWWAFQLVPSPEVAVGRGRDVDVDGVPHETTRSAFGLRWQLSPVLWSWGTNRHSTRWRYFVVDPLARASGSIEADLTLEYLWGDVDRMLVRPGVRGNFPLLHRGEYLSGSFGTSVYRYDGTARIAYDAGVYVMAGLFGVTLTVAPTHGALTSIATFRIRHF